MSVTELAGTDRRRVQLGRSRPIPWAVPRFREAETCSRPYGRTGLTYRIYVGCSGTGTAPHAKEGRSWPLHTSPSTTASGSSWPGILSEATQPELRESPNERRHIRRLFERLLQAGPVHACYEAGSPATTSVAN